MNFEDTIIIPKPKRDEQRGLVTVKQTRASLVRGHQKFSEHYGFELQEGDPRFSVLGTRREGNRAIITYGMTGRRLDADQLAYELNN